MAMSTHSPRFAKVVVTFEPREDGGLRAYSEDVPGFVLSHSNAQAVIRDVGPALERILTAMWGVPVRAGKLTEIHETDDEIDDAPPCRESRQEYVAHVQ